MRGKACRYLLGHQHDLDRFLTHAEMDFSFVGHEAGGKNRAALYTLVAACEKHRINPIAYLTDVLVRVRSHPASRIDELLPQNWKPPPDGGD